MKILIIDDDLAILDALNIILGDMGHEVFIFDSPQNLEKNIKKINPGLIFIDILLNGYNGCETIKKLKKDAKYRKIPIVVLSANNQIKKLTAEAGADDFLAKPFDIQDLGTVIKKHSST